MFTVAHPQCFWTDILGKESLSWYLSRQPVIIAHLCLLIVRSFPAVRTQVGGLWFQAQGGLSWPWDTREVLLRPHGSGMLWLLIRLCTAHSLGIGPSKAFHDRAPGPRAERFRIACNSCSFSKANTNTFFLFLDWPDDWFSFYTEIQENLHWNPGRNFSNCMKANTLPICVKVKTCIDQTAPRWRWASAKTIILMC